MTFDAAQTDSVTEEAEAEGGRLQELIVHARVVLWDFDGPICGLFASHPAERVAYRLVDWLKGQGLHGLLTEGERKSEDPHAVLRAVDRRHPRSDLVAELEERLTREELQAAKSAAPTVDADDLIRAWSAAGVRLAITTNNSPEVARNYLEGHELLSHFSSHIYGRTRDLRLLKPHPDCLERALRAMEVKARDALMIGDADTDFLAAQKAGVPFLGYARNQRKERRLRAAGARVIVDSLEPVLQVVRTGGPKQSVQD
ncbi:HAD family hydrolase [Streptomyces sp. NPDC001443]